MPQHNARSATLPLASVSDWTTFSSRRTLDAQSDNDPLGPPPRRRKRCLPTVCPWRARLPAPTGSECAQSPIDVC